MHPKEAIAEIKERIVCAAKEAGRKADDIILLGATKTVDASRIQEAVDAGLLYIGENRVQELCDKYAYVHGAHWHFIGHLQTNKVKYIIDKAELIHAVESSRLLDEIDKQAAKMDRCAEVLLEVNASGEATKFGTGYEEVMPLIAENENRKHVKIKGLMTIGPHVLDENKVREVFSAMYALYEKLGRESFENTRMEYLSMGMSGDFCTAIKEGANIVRIGSAIFGNREWRK